MQFEKSGKGRTFLIYDEDCEDFQILAYYTLAMKVLKIPEDLYSNRKLKNLDGFSSKINGQKITEFPAILIGQIGKNETYRQSIEGMEVMQYCMNTLLEGQSLLGGRIIMLECKNIPYLIDLYKKFGFATIDKDYEPDELLQLIKVLQEEELNSN